MRSIPLIIFYNRSIDDAKEKHDIIKACEMLKKLRKLEIKERAVPGSYRLIELIAAALSKN